MNFPENHAQEQKYEDLSIKGMRLMILLILLFLLFSLESKNL